MNLPPTKTCGKMADAIRCNQMPSDAIRRNQTQSDEDLWEGSDAIRRHSDADLWESLRAGELLYGRSDLVALVAGRIRERVEI
jgi:hypothetical protein